MARTGQTYDALADMPWPVFEALVDVLTSRPAGPASAPPRPAPSSPARVAGFFAR